MPHIHKQTDFLISELTLQSKKNYLKLKNNKNFIRQNIKQKDNNIINSQMETLINPPPSVNNTPIFADIAMQTEEEKVNCFFRLCTANFLGI